VKKNNISIKKTLTGIKIIIILYSMKPRNHNLSKKTGQMKINVINKETLKNLTKEQIDDMIDPEDRAIVELCQACSFLNSIKIKK